MKFAYADPPYLGLAEKLYGHLHPEAAAYDRIETHQALIDRLCDEFPDGWAMSLYAPSLRAILPLCPEDARVAAWVKTWTPFSKGANPCYAWEPVIFRGGRERKRGDWVVVDWMGCPSVRGHHDMGPRWKGTKPEALILWIFQLLGMRPEDEFHDLFSGSGAVTRAWEKWRCQPQLRGQRLRKSHLRDLPMLELGEVLT